MPKQHAVKMYREVKLKLDAFIIPVLDGNEQAAWYSGRFSRGKVNPIFLTFFVLLCYLSCADPTIFCFPPLLLHLLILYCWCLLLVTIKMELPPRKTERDSVDRMQVARICLVWAQLVRRLAGSGAIDLRGQCPVPLVPRTSVSFPLTLRCRHVYATTMWRHTSIKMKISAADGVLRGWNLAPLLFFW